MANQFKVLFIYYSPRKMSLVPSSLALMSASLKAIDVKVKLFDTSFYVNENDCDADECEEQNLTVHPYSQDLKKSEYRIVYRNTDPGSDLDNLIGEYQPDLLAVTAVECTFEETLALLRKVRYRNIPTIMGGVFATFAPEIAIQQDEIDIICRGDGEKAIVELVKRLRDGKSYSDIPNLWIKHDDGIITKNSMGPLESLDDHPLPDMTLFEPARFYRAMAGKIYKMFAVETHRGCVFNCGFCNSPLQNQMYRNETGKIYFRSKSIEKVREEIDAYARMGAEYLFFWADNFFAYRQREIDEFCEMYSDYRIPFYCQSHPENLTIDKVNKLKSVGMQRVGIGIEHGNEEFRRRVVNRRYSNEMLLKRLKILSDAGVEYSTNNIIGFPDETPELVMDTVELNRRHAAADISCSIFTPFHGTPLRKLAVDKGYLKNADMIAPSNADESVLDMPGFTKEEILGKRRTFMFYIKFPKSRWSEIARAEKMTPAGDMIWKRLREEYVATYLS